nr:FAD-dependent monooxygenase [Geodermatophilus sabuli]
MGRQLLLDVLARRARELGVRIAYEHDVRDLGELAGADLVVLADGARSRLRRSRADAFGTTERAGGDKHIWLGSSCPFPDFTFAFVETAAGWIWFHAYGFAGEASTVIVECTEPTWRRLGFDAMGDAASVAELSRIFARQLAGHPLRLRPDVSGASQWSTFTTVGNERWSAGNVTLLGDCAHTAHFSIGSGTRMAVEDASALSRAVAGRGPAELPAVLRRYEDERRPAVLDLQADADRSARWFEEVDRHIRRPPLEFGYALRMRRDPTAVDHSGAPPPSLRYGLHRATQWRLGRGARRVVAAGRQAVRDQRSLTA